LSKTEVRKGAEDVELLMREGGVLMAVARNLMNKEIFSVF